LVAFLCAATDNLPWILWAQSEVDDAIAKLQHLKLELSDCQKVSLQAVLLLLLHAAVG
jgi:hypothetical protein